MRSILANHSALAERRQHVVRTVKIRHFDVRRADPLRVVGIGAHAWRDIELFREVNRREIMRGLRDFCVEHLDDVQLTRAHERLEDRFSESGALGIKRMRRVHQSTLCFNATDHLGHGQDVRNALGEEQTDDFSRRRANLFADDDANAEITLESLCGFNGMVIGDAHRVELDLFHALRKLLQRGARVARRERVQVTVEPNPTSASRRWRPGWIRINIQQQ